MATVPNGIPVRLIAVFGDAELPEGGVEVGTLSLPVTVTESDDAAVPGEVILEVTPDVSVFQRLADFLTNESSSDQKHRALDTEPNRLAVEQSHRARAAVYENPCASEHARVAADRRLHTAIERQTMRSGRRF